MEEPRGNGAWPVLYPSEEVKLFYKGQQIEGPTIVENPAEVLLVPVENKARSEYEIVVSRDKMTVQLKTRFTKGTEFEICDAELTRKLRVRTKPVGSITPEPIDPRLVIAEIQERKFQGQIHYEAVISACRGLKNVDVVILGGIPVEPPIDGKIEMVWRDKTQTPEQSELKQIDHRERKAIESVDVGDVLAYWHPPQPGTPGRNVYGEPVAPLPPRNARFRAGRGVKLISDGTVAVAERAGRPVLRNGTISVTPQMVIEGNVDLTTGNIKFKGDVIVLGDVCESMKVEAGGVVEVKGSVYHARIISGSHVVINRKVIGSSICAGQQQGGLMKSLAFVKQILPEMDKLMAACDQLQRHPKFGTEDLSRCGVGYLIKLLLEMRFPHLTKKFEKLEQCLEGIESDSPDDDLADLIAQLRAIPKHFIGSGPLELQSIEAIKKLSDSLQGIADHLDGLLEFPASITVDYCQNGILEATGKILVTGSLVYGSDMVSGDRITILGECRGGSYRAKSGIRLGVVGSEGMGKTFLAVSEKGTIGAKMFCPGVYLKIGSTQREITTVCHNHTFGEIDSLSTEAISG